MNRAVNAALETPARPTAPKPVYQVQVRALVEFALRTGDLGGEREFIGPHRALAGIRGHQQVQRSRPAGYQTELGVCHEFETGEFILRIQGRIDGLLERAGEVLIEEIKTVRPGWDRVPDPLHWAQVKIYGFIFGHERGLKDLALKLSYLELESGELTEFLERLSLDELSRFFEQTLGVYLEWIKARHEWCQLRDKSIRKLEFPFSYRPGQRELAVAAYRAFARGEHLFLEAPTGIGKTISIIFPAVKALGEGKLERVFYLTARTVGRAVAEKAFSDLRQAGLRLRALALTAKEKICLHDGQPCDARTCPLAQGYYDHCKDAMRAALQHEEISRRVLEEVGRQHHVCPFELSLDLSSWVDAVICDYNYVFDPKVYLRRHFAEEAADYAFLIDEAHNLVERAREMFSADLDTAEIQDVRRALKQSLPRCARALSKLTAGMRKLCAAVALAPELAEAFDPLLELELFQAKSAAEALVSAGGESSSLVAARRAYESARGEQTSQARRQRASPTWARRDFPAELLSLFDDALKEAEAWLVRNEEAEFRDSLLELYFRLNSFRRTAELYDDHFVTIIEAGASVRVRMFCLDPALLLKQALARGKAAVFFSATLTPLEYYRELLGGSTEDRTLQLSSPFPPENLAILVEDRIDTRFKERAATLDEVVQAIGTLVQERRGNYLVYLPSYQYLTAIVERFHALYPTVSILVQKPAMSEPEREAFLAAFAADHEQSLVGFAVLGGVFGEGIDLVGDRLIGAIIIGVGLPQLCVERDLIRDYFHRKLGSGFEYAYTFPGMNRVLQATGRVIRSETDRGVVLLVDTRFRQGRYLRLFPGWWRPVRVGSGRQISEMVRQFWDR